MWHNIFDLYGRHFMSFYSFKITFKFIDPIREIIFKEEEEELGLGLEIILGII